MDVIDSASANDSALAASIRTSGLIYLLGGFPRHLAETLANSLCWRAALDSFEAGAVIAGSSAGAMVLCEHYYDPYEKKFGARIGGMKPAVKGGNAEPLQPGVMYRLLVKTSDKRQAQHDFSTTKREP